MKKYNKRTWLNNPNSSTSSVVAFDGEVPYEDKIYRDTFLKISDCKTSIKLHKLDSESMNDFIDRLYILTLEIEEFMNHLQSN